MATNMLLWLQNLWFRATKVFHDVRTPAKQSPQWEALAKKIVKGEVCEACGSDSHLQVHHRIPFHVDSSLELNPSNLIVLCMSTGFECHLRVGHGKSWKTYNPNVDWDIQRLKSSNRAIVLEEIRKRCTKG